MILGSHNTMTYLKPLKWWMWLGVFIAKCQKENYEKQYELGARWFDLRISIPKQKDNSHGSPIFSHGIIDYKGVEPREVLEWLNTKNDVYCRIVLEKGGDMEQNLFMFYAKQWLTQYTNLKVVQIAKKGVWKDLLEPTHKTPYDKKGIYASLNGHHPKHENLLGVIKTKSKRLIYNICPWIYAKQHNKENIKKHKKDKIVLLIDFIGTK